MEHILKPGLTMLTNTCKFCALAKVLRLHGMTSGITVMSKQSRPCLQSQAYRLLQTSKKNSGMWRTVTRYGLVYCLVPAGVGLILYWGESRRGSGLALDCLPRITVQCEDAVVMKPQQQQQQQQQTVKQWIHSGFLLYVQCVRMCLTFGPLLCLYPLTFLSTRLHKVWLWVLFHAVQICGPVYIKLGQWASTRRDLFSPEFCELFSQLHSMVQPHDWCHTEQVLVRAYGKQWHEVIKIDKTQQPLGSGCIAQVYKAYVHMNNLTAETLEAIDDSDTLDDIYFRDGVEIPSHSDTFSLSDECDVNFTGDPEAENTLPYQDDPNYIAVAVKVVHPYVRQSLSRELVLMQGVARVLESIIPSLHWVNLTQCVRQFSLSMTRQMDMIHEARCLKHFHADFIDVPSIRIPVPVMSLVRQNILVESYEEGQPISDFIPSEEKVCPGLKEKLADLGVDALLQMVFVKNFVHGDLHPGNILVQNADAFTQQTEDSLVMVDIGDVVMTTVAHKDCPVRLVLLDCGITASLEQDDRVKFQQVFTAVVKGQGEVVADLFLEKSHHMQCKDPEAFRRDMAHLVNTARDTTLQLSKLKVSALMSDLFSMLSRHHIQLESNFATIILAMGIVEGLGRSLDPHLDILSKASSVLLGEVFRG
ncbi:putative aarF domain-containing protein kinase 2 [Babylonia areolata]|uniref:putative aarF domain-containing protein kinase 2 n=1 Tax=Babylonia areolata TaxID=304850 RepID=UPI003FD3605E